MLFLQQVLTYFTKHVMDAFGHGHGVLKSLHIFGLLVVFKSTFIVFMHVYNMCKAIIEF
jgi:hypothetical protein